MEVAEVIAGRNNEQCRDRWSDKINRKWTDDEDKALLEAVGNLGTSNWKGVSECLGNQRTEQDVGAFYFSFVLLWLIFLLSVGRGMTRCYRSRTKSQKHA